MWATFSRLLGSKLVRVGSLIGLVALATAAPVSVSSEGVAPNCAKAGSLSTCCRDLNSACPGVGQFWYDTGLCGTCDDPHPC